MCFCPNSADYHENGKGVAHHTHTHTHTDTFILFIGNRLATAAGTPPIPTCDLSMKLCTAQLNTTILNNSVMKNLLIM